MTYNGEIFNYRELAAELAGQGHKLGGRSDTEVLLHLYQRYGLDMFSRMNGMYAFALWDTERRSLLLARDGIGVKPLYYCEMSSGVLFASEIKALLACGEVPRDLDPEALDEHLTFLWDGSSADYTAGGSQVATWLGDACARRTRHAPLATLRLAIRWYAA